MYHGQPEHNPDLGEEMAKRFSVTNEGRNVLGLAELCERFANDQWIPAHTLPHEVEALVLDQFKRAVEAELKLLVVLCEAGMA
jgi:hypothetical protein